MTQPRRDRRVVLLAGGTGGAKLAVGLQDRLLPGALSVVTNPADDVDFWGLRICPDLDAVLFRLAGIFNQEAGYGVAGETFAAHGMMRRLGEPDWFWLGDQDLAIHILRTRLLREGLPLTEVALELGRRLRIPGAVIPVTDDVVRTFFSTAHGRLGFQEYFVREKLGPKLFGIEFEGLEKARASAAALECLAGAQLTVIGPSNPLISIAPLISLLRPHLDPNSTLAVSPIVGGRSLKGPTVDMMIALGLNPTATGVAAEYRDLARWYVLDRVDAAEAPAIEALGFQVLLADTVMEDVASSGRLAEQILRNF
ncbi:MAG: 2-phospho-L-lactate transferase CofD family protein [Candidatus Dormibacteraceae bacterium]